MNQGGSDRRNKLEYHVMKILVDFKKRFWFNLDGNVGVNSPNLRDDVELIQFGYFAMAKNPKTDAPLRPVYAAVKPGATYSGGANDPLTLAIIAHQQSRGGTQDKHVSVIHSPSLVYSGSRPGFMLVPLVNCIFDLMPNDWPRLDKHPDCPAELKRVVRALLLHPPAA